MKKWTAPLLVCLVSFLLALPGTVLADTTEDIMNNLILPRQQYDTGLSAAYYNNSKQEVQVDQQSGQVTLRQTDYSLPGRNGLDLELTRIYRSGQATWYNMYAKRSGSTWVNCLKADTGSSDYLSYYEQRYNIGVGMRFSFPSIEHKGSYRFLHSESGAVYRLLGPIDGKYTLEGHSVEDLKVERDVVYDGVTYRYCLTEKDGKKTFFSSDGSILMIANRYGDKITFEYQTYSTNTGDRRLIHTITDTMGRVVTLDYGTSSTYQVPENGDLHHLFDVTATLPDGRILLYVKSCFNYRLSNRVSTRERLQEVQIRADDTVPGTTKWWFTYEQVRCNFDFNGGDDYSEPPQMTSGGSNVYNTWENITAVENEREHSAKVFKFRDATRCFGTKGNLMYRKIRENIDLRLDNLSIGSDGALQSYTGDVKRRLVYTYNGEPDGYEKGITTYPLAEFNSQSELSDFTFYGNYGRFQFVSGSGRDGTGGVVSSNLSFRPDLRSVLGRYVQLKKPAEVWFDAKVAEAKPGSKIVITSRTGIANPVTEVLGEIPLSTEWGSYHCTIPAGDYILGFLYEFNDGQRSVCSMDNISIGYACSTRVNDALDTTNTTRESFFNAAGLRTKEIENGADHYAQTDYTYDGRKMLTTQKTTSYEKVSGVQQTIGTTAQRRYTYDQYGNLTNYTGDDCKNYSYTYDPEKFHRLTHVSGSNILADYTLDDFGNTVTETRYDTVNGGNVVTSVVNLSYDEHGNLTGKNVDGETNVHYEYAPIGEGGQGGLYLTREYSLDADGQTVLADKRYEYDFVTGLKTADVSLAADGSEIRTQYAYDWWSRITGVTYPDGTEKTYEYWPYGVGNGLPEEYTVVSQYQDRITRQCYDLDWNLVYDGRRSRWGDSTTPDLTWRYTYDSRGNRTCDTDRMGGKTLYTYDSAGRLKRRAFQASSGGEFEPLTLTYGAVKTGGSPYDPVYATMTVTDAKGQEKHYTFDKAGNVTEEAVDVPNPEGGMMTATARYTYNSNNDMTRATDPLGNETVYENRYGFLRAVSAPDGGATAYTYTGMDQPEETLEPGGKLTRCIYDQAGRLTEQRTGWADSIAARYDYKRMEYDTRGNLLSVRQGHTTSGDAGRTDDTLTTYGYDVRGRMVEQYEWIEGDTYRYTEYEYDAYGNQTLAVTHGEEDQTNIAQFRTYDDLDRVILESTSAMYQGTPAGEQKTGYEYDGNGNVLTQQQYTSKDEHQDLHFAYDSRNRLIRQEEFAGEDVRVTELTYDAVGNLEKKMLLGGGGQEAAVTSYTYDARGQVQSVTDALGGITRYGYDKAGNKIMEADARYSAQPLSSCPGKRYGYDSMNRLCQLRLKEGAEETILEQRAYDGRGNVILRKGGEELAAGKTGKEYSHDYMDRQTGYTIANDQVPSKSVYYDGAGRKVKEENFRDPGSWITNTWTYYHDGAVKSVQYGEGGPAEEYAYDRTGKLYSERTAADGRTTKTWLTLFGSPYRTEYPDGTTETADFQWYLGLMTLAVDRMGRRKKYAYAKDGQILEVEERYGFLVNREDVEELNVRTHYEYDVWGRLVEQRVVDMKNSDGDYTHGTTVQQVFYSYDTMMRKTWQYGPGERKQTIEYDAAGNVTAQKQAVTENYDDVTRYEYDAAGRKTKDVILMESSQLEGVNAPADSEYPSRKRLETVYTYDKGGNLKTKTDARGNVATYAYNMDGWLESQRSASGETTTYGYDASGNLLGMTDPQGKYTTFVYDDRGRQTGKTVRAGDVTQNWTWTYDVMGNLVSEQTPPLYAAGKRMTYIYDVMNRRVKSFDGDGRLVSYVKYDNLDRVVKTVDGRQCERPSEVEDEDGTTVEYDDLGRVFRQTDALGNATDYTYDLLGNVTSVYDANSNVTEYAYNTDGTVSKATLPDGGEIRYEYDLKGRVTKESRKAGLLQTVSKEYEYTSLDAVSDTVYEDGTAVQVRYDADGGVASVQNQNGKTTTYQYDHAGRLVGQQTPVADGVSLTETYTYNGATGDLMQKTSGSRQVDYTYAYGRLLSESTNAGGVSEYSYDTLGNVSEKRVRRMAGTWDTQSYVYDEYGRVSSSTKHLGSGASTVGYAYDVMGSVVEAKQPGAYANPTDAQRFTTYYEYDKVGRVRQVSAPYDGDGTYQRLTTSYQYDGLGNVTKVTDESGNEQTYTYDTQSRVTGVTYNNTETAGYEYDLLGNQTKEILPNGTWEKEYDSRGRVTKQKNPDGAAVAELSYDAMGNVVSRKDALGNETTYQYNALGQVTATTLPEGGTSAANYNQYGEVQSVYNGLGQATDYGYDEAGRLVSVTDALGNQTSYTYDDAGNRTGVTDANGNTRSYRYGAFGALEESTDAKGQTQSYAYDINGQVSGSVDRMGNELSYSYDARGNLKTKSVKLQGEEQVRPENTVSYQYNAHGDRVEMADSSGTWGYAYDGRYRLTGVSKDGAEQISYQYDENDQVSGKTYAGASTTYTYDNQGRMTRLGI